MHRWQQGGEAPRSHDRDVERARKQLEQLGIPPDEVMDEWAKPETKPPIEVLELPETCRDAVLTFVACTTQWQYVAPGLGAPIPLGLDYSRIESVLRLRRVPRKRWSDVFEDLRFMEAVALPLLAP